jgi:hypothetical protein
MIGEYFINIEDAEALSLIDPATLHSIDFPIQQPE